MPSVASEDNMAVRSDGVLLRGLICHYEEKEKVSAIVLSRHEPRKRK